MELNIHLLWKVFIKAKGNNLELKTTT